MAKRTHIVIAESSAIIRCGVVALLQRAQIPNIDIAEVGDLASIEGVDHSQSPDLLIINPLLLGGATPMSIKNHLGSANLKIIALQCTLLDQTQLQGFDEVIILHETEQSLKDKVVNTALSAPESDGKRELSAREREIIVCVVKGMTNKQIADTLCLSTHTVIAHRRNIAGKLQIHSPAGLTIYAIVNKLVDLSDIKNSISQGRDEEMN